MEVVLGFAIGYYIGVRQGRRGLQEAIESAQAIMASPETRRMLSTYTVNASGGGANYTDLETAIINSPAGPVVRKWASLKLSNWTP